MRPYENIIADQMARREFGDGDVTYICRAEPGTAAASALWQVMKMDESGDNCIVTWADGDNKFDNVATDEATVKALSFS